MDAIDEVPIPIALDGKVRSEASLDEWIDHVYKQTEMATVYLQEANLRGADLRGANLGDANLQEADLQAARFDHLRDLRKHATDDDEASGNAEGA